MCKIYQKKVERYNKLEHLATNCTEDMRNNERVNQILKENEERIQLDKKDSKVEGENKIKEVIKDNLEIIEIKIRINVI